MPFAFGLSSCGAPGDPVPRRPPVPQAIADLAARQAGERVVLTFTLPATTVEGEPLAAPPQLEIYRAFLPAGTRPEHAAEAAKLVYTVPGAVVETYVADGRMRFEDPLKPEELGRHAGEQAAYLVRTRASKRKASADSNVAALRVYPVAEAIADLAPRLTEPAVELRWSPPVRTTAGASLAGVASYRIYRAEAEPGTAATDAAKAKLKAPFELLGVSPVASYRDIQFEVDRTYIYTVRSVVQYEADSVESADSRAVVVTPRDTFPPAAPRDLIFIVAAATRPDEPAAVELSWAISAETDLAGYYVYRSDREGTLGERLNRELLPTPAFRDTSVASGRRFYRVTAVDQRGNESAPSAPVAVEVPSQANKNGR